MWISYHTIHLKVVKVSTSHELGHKMSSMIYVNVSKSIKTFFCLVLLTMNFSVFASAESEVIQTIILINREAELVDLSADGEVLKRYVAIPDYFSSGRSHQRSLKKSLELLKDYGFEENHTLPGSSDLAAADLQHYMVDKLGKRPCETSAPLINTGDLTLSLIDDQAQDQSNIYGLMGLTEALAHHAQTSEDQTNTITQSSTDDIEYTAIPPPDIVKQQYGDFSRSDYSVGIFSYT